MSKKVMVIGGAGNMGIPTVERLAARGYEVSVYSLVPYGGPSSGEVRSLVGNRDDRESFLAAMRQQRYDAVIDFACFTRQHAVDDREAFPEVERLVFCSTGAVYGGVPPEHLPVTEDYRPAALHWPYGENKRSAEDYLLGQYHAGGYPVTIIRPSFTYGRGNGIARQLGGGNGWIDRIRRGKPILTGSLQTLRNFLYADDTAAAFVGALEHPVCAGQCYNMVGPKVHDWGEFYRAAMKALGREVELVEIPALLLQRLQAPAFPIDGSILQGLAHNSFYSGAKIARDIPEFREATSLEEGLALAFRRLDEQGLIPDSRLDTTEDDIIAHLRFTLD